MRIWWIAQAYDYYAAIRVLLHLGALIVDLDNHNPYNNFLVTKREETTRSHPEHGRKDS